MDILWCLNKFRINLHKENFHRGLSLSQRFQEHKYLSNLLKIMSISSLKVVCRKQSWAISLISITQTSTRISRLLRKTASKQDRWQMKMHSVLLQWIIFHSLNLWSTQKVDCKRTILAILHPSLIWTWKAIRSIQRNILMSKIQHKIPLLLFLQTKIFKIST